MEVLESWYGTVGFVPILCTMEFAWTLEKKVRLKDATMSATMREVSPDAVLRI
jgi:hypothetical protein